MTGWRPTATPPTRSAPAEWPSLAKHYGIPFYVLGPTSTIDLSCPDGDHIPIEQRDPEEIRSLWYRGAHGPRRGEVLQPRLRCHPPQPDLRHHHGEGDLLPRFPSPWPRCFPTGRAEFPNTQKMSPAAAGDIFDLTTPFFQKNALYGGSWLPPPKSCCWPEIRSQARPQPASKWAV